VLAYLAHKPDPLIDQDPPEQPGELILYDDLREWHALPCEGGYLDQPWTLMQDLRMVRTALRHRQSTVALRAETRGEYDDLAKQASAMAGVQ